MPHINWDTQECENKFTIKPNPHYGMQVNQAMVDLALRNSPSQHISEPTRGSNILDLVFTTCPALIQKTTIYAGMSDHDCIITDLNLKVTRPKTRPRKIFLYKRANVDEMKEEIESA